MPGHASPEQPSRSPLPEPALTAVQDAQQLVLKKGDIPQRLKWLHRTPVGGAAMQAGFAVAGTEFGIAVVEQEGLQYSAFVAIIGAAAVSFATKPVGRQLQRYRIRKQRQAYEAIGQQLGGDSIEFYRTHTRRRKNRRLHAVWEPAANKFESTEALADALVNVSQMVDNDKIQSVGIPMKVLDALAEPLPQDVAVMERSEWLEEADSTPIKDVSKADEELCDFSPAQLKAFVEELRRPEEHPLKTYMELLRELKPQHPLLRGYRHLNLDNPKQLRHLERSLRQSVESKLQAIHVQGEVLPTGTILHHKIPTTGKVAIQSQRQYGGNIKWMLNDGKHSGEQSRLLNHHNVTLEELALLPHNYRRLPRHRAIELCEVAAWLAAHDAIHPERRNQLSSQFEHQLSELGSTVARPQPVRGMQMRIADRVLDRHPPADAHEKTGIAINRWRWSRIGKAALTGFLTAAAFTAVSGALQQYTDHFYEHKIDAARKQYKNQHGHDKKYSKPDGSGYELLDDDADKAADKVAQDWKYQAASKLLNQAYNLEDQTENRLGPYIHPGTLSGKDLSKLARNQKGGAGEGTADGNGTGNRGNEKAEPLWYIDRLNGMHDEGYWTVTTADSLQSKPLDWKPRNLAEEIDERSGKGAAYYKNHTKIENQLMAASQLVGPDHIDMTRPLLHVQRLLLTRSEVFDDNANLVDTGAQYQPSPLDDAGPAFVVPIPVLEGTRVAAATTNGDAARTLRLDNGTTVMLVRNSDDPMHIEYWLSPDDSQHAHAVNPISSTYDNHRLAPVVKEWKPAVPNVGSLSTTQRIGAEQRYMNQRFKFKPQPVTAKAQTMDRRALTTISLKTKVGNDFTTATMLATGNPHQLNYANGFNNRDTAKQIASGHSLLSAIEQTAWDVDHGGTVHDATPFNGSRAYATANPEGDQAFSNPANDQRKKVEELAAVLALAAAGTLTFKFRKQIPEAGRKTKRGLAHGALATTGKRRSSLAYNVLNQAVHAGLPLNDTNYQAAFERAAEPEHQIGRAEWREFVRINDRKATAAAAAQARSQASNRQARRALRLSRRLHLLHTLALDEPVLAPREQKA